MDPHADIEVLYSCHTCGLRDIKVKVRARTDETVVAWAEQIMMQAIDLDHSHRSPLCRATSVQNVKIPTTGADQIGGVPLQ